MRDLVNLLESKGIAVEFASHPVAERMPGHMNVLLAEAELPYEKLRDMEAINTTCEKSQSRGSMTGFFQDIFAEITTSILTTGPPPPIIERRNSGVKLLILTPETSIAAFSGGGR
jgi:hypothetical protein